MRWLRKLLRWRKKRLPHLMRMREFRLEDGEMGMFRLRGPGVFDVEMRGTGAVTILRGETTFCVDVTALGPEVTMDASGQIIAKGKAPDGP